MCYLLDSEVGHHHTVYPCVYTCVHGLFFCTTCTSLQQFLRAKTQRWWQSFIESSGWDDTCEITHARIISIDNPCEIIYERSSEQRWSVKYVRHPLRSFLSDDLLWMIYCGSSIMDHLCLIISHISCIDMIHAKMISHISSHRNDSMNNSNQSAM